MTDEILCFEKDNMFSFHLLKQAVFPFQQIVKGDCFAISICVENTL